MIAYLGSSLDTTPVALACFKKKKTHLSSNTTLVFNTTLKRMCPSFYRSPQKRGTKNILSNDNILGTGAQAFEVISLKVKHSKLWCSYGKKNSVI